MVRVQEAKTGAPPSRRRAVALLYSEGPFLVLLLAFTLAFYRQMALQGRILVDYDVLTYFYPNLAYAADSLREGRLPLWNPYIFTGAPFLANLQSALFYPPNWAFLALPTARFYSLSVVIHVFLMAAGGYAFARLVLQTGRIPSLAAALALAFGGYAGSLITHLNQLQAAAWMPWLYLLLWLGLQHPRPWPFASFSAVLALILLAGHAQVAYIIIVGAGLYALCWTVGSLPSYRASLRSNDPGRSGSGSYEQLRSLLRRSLLPISKLLAPFPERETNEGRSPRRGAGRLSPVLALAGSLALGFALAALQLVPAAELSARSVRADGMSYKEATAFSLPPWMLLKSLLPLYKEHLPTTEWLAYVGVVGVVLAAAGATWNWRRSRYFVVMAMVALLLGLGLFGPIYPILFGIFPGLNLFRVPARWMLLYSFATSMLVALGVDAIRLRGAESLAWARSIDRVALRAALARLLRIVLLLAVPMIVLLLYRLFADPAYYPQRPNPRVLMFWTVLLVGGMALAVFGRRWSATVLVAALAGELMLASSGLVVNEGNVPQAFEALRPAVAHLRADPGLHRVLPFTDAIFEPGDLAEMRDMLKDVLPPQGVYEYVVTAKHKETLTPNLPMAYRIPSLDGYDGGVLPLRDYVELKEVLPLSGSRASDARLREQLETIPDPRLLGSLNVKYVLMDRLRDVWLEDVYYDMAITTTLRPGEQIELPATGSYRVDAVGLVTHLSGASGLPDGASFAFLELQSTDGQSQRFELKAGAESAEGEYQEGQTQHKKARVAAAWPNNQPGWSYYARLPLASPVYLERATLRYTAKEGELHLRALSAIDARTKAGYPVPISPALRLSYLGDVKIYENLAAQPRAYLVHRATAVGDYLEALARMQQPSFKWGQEVVVEGPAPELSSPPPGADEQVEIVSYQPEEVVIRISAASPALLVLSDAYYPGWKATVDSAGQPILRVNHSLRGLAIEPGEHEVVFRFQPASFRLGLGISLAALLVLGGIAVLEAPALRSLLFRLRLRQH